MKEFCLIRGDCLSPTFDNRKQIAPAVGAIVGAGISALGSVGGGLLGNAASSKAIEKQAEMQQQLIDKQNAYNTPLEQRARLEQAGFNPYLAMSGGLGSTGNQMQSATIGPADTSSLPNGIFNAANALGNAALMAAQVRNMNAEAAGKEIDNLSKQNINEEQLALLKQQVAGQSIVNNSAQYDLQHMKPAQLMELQGKIDKLSHETALLLQKGTTESLNQDLIVKQIEQLGLDNKRARAVLPYVIRSAELENKEQQMRVSTGYQNAFTNRLSAYAAQTSAGAAQMNALTNQGIFGEQKRHGYFGAQVGLLHAQINGQHWTNRRLAKELPYSGLKKQAEIVNLSTPSGPYGWFNRSLTHGIYHYYK